ncbi:thioesterase II family protein [Streptomyces sp. NPDC005017]|uniref:thioesterase II family protein n=1 Tax=Streptomyces sp. NPDC005017 TaxID=3364706 RepID=UPI0036A7721E
MTTGTEEVEQWFPGWTAAGDRARLLCLPHLGGGPTAFAGWPRLMPGIQVCPVRLPGRGPRYREPAPSGVDDLVESLGRVLSHAPRHTGPLGVYGHGPGAAVAFELVRALRRSGGLPAQTSLFVAGRAAPHLEPRFASMSELPDVRLTALLSALGGTPVQLLSDRHVTGQVLTTVRADLRLHETYRYRPEPRLSVPVTVFGATDDPLVTFEEAAAWEQLTEHTCVLHMLEGGHLAVLDHRSTVTRAITQLLRPPR